MIAPTTRDGARELFASKLSYEQITTNDIRALEGFLAIEYAQHERNGEHMEMHPCYRKKHQPQINLADGGRGIKSAFLRVSGFYFSGREAISFNEDGFIGFAGWADDTNVQPFLRAFHKWVCEWMVGVTYRGLRRSTRRGLASFRAVMPWSIPTTTRATDRLSAWTLCAR